MMHTQLFVLFAVAVAAATVQSTLATAPVSANPYSRSSLWQERRGNGIVQDHAVAESFEVFDSYAINGNVHHRQLQHGSHQPQSLPFCPVCRIHGKTFFHIFWKGHCRVGGFLMTCLRRKLKASFFFAAVPASMSPTMPPLLEQNRTSMSTATGSQAQEVLAIVRIADNDTSTLVPAVGCFSDADCELSARGLEAVNGSAPVSRGGVVTAECIGADREEGVPGMCICSYRVRSAAADADAAPKSDICVRRTAFESVSIVTDSTGSARLVNSTARGNVTLDVDLVEVEQNVPEDYEPTDEPTEAVAGFAIMSSMTRLSRADTDADDGRRPAVVDVAMASRIDATPDPAPPRGPAPADGPPPAAIRPAEAPVPAPAQAPAPAPGVQAQMRGGVSGASRRSVISEEIDVSMRVRHA